MVGKPREDWRGNCSAQVEIEPEYSFGRLGSMTGSRDVAGPHGEDTLATEEPARDGANDAAAWERSGELVVPVLIADEALLAARFLRVSEDGD